MGCGGACGDVFCGTQGGPRHAIPPGPGCAGGGAAAARVRAAWARRSVLCMAVLRRTVLGRDAGSTVLTAATVAAGESAVVKETSARLGPWAPGHAAAAPSSRTAGSGRLRLRAAASSYLNRDPRPLSLAPPSSVVMLFLNFVYRGVHSPEAHWQGLRLGLRVGNF